MCNRMLSGAFVDICWCSMPSETCMFLSCRYDMPVHSSGRLKPAVR